MARAKRNVGELLRPLSAARARGAGAAAPEVSPALEALWQVIAQIPRGCASTYGDVARAAGLPGRARQAAYALRMSPPQLHLPWHRVVGAGGRIVFPRASRNFREQARRLRAEGVTVRDGRVARAALTDLATL
jgi:methylated-DNA-protein-cysteine methyltransferase-like protein